MAFCRKCGKEFNEGDQFCFYCGAALYVNDEKKDNDRKNDDSSSIKRDKNDENTADTSNIIEKNDDVILENQRENKAAGINITRNKKLILAGIICLAIILLIVIIVSNTKKNSDSTSGYKNAKEENVDSTHYANYENSTVFFKVDYPEGYNVIEPDDNNVLITDGENADFQVSVEYAYHTTENTAIYSANDFAKQIENDKNVLKNWLGTLDADVSDAKKCVVGGKEAFEYDVSLRMDSGFHTGKVYLISGDGEFGCYSFLWMVNEDCEKSELYKMQCNKMVDTFKLTGACQAEGYKIHRFDELNMQFMVRDEGMGKIENSNGVIFVYPVDGVFTEANIVIENTGYAADEKSINELLEIECNFFFDYYDNTQYLSKPLSLDYGRYDYTGVDVGYSFVGENYTLSVFVFIVGGEYWAVKMESTDEYYNACATAVADILFSVKFDNDSENSLSQDNTSTVTSNTDSTGEIAKEVILDIQNKKGFVSDSYWEPLAVLDDFNGDGVDELLAVYERDNGDGIIKEVLYELYSISSAGAISIKSDTLFVEVGGNGGVIGIVQSDGKSYLAIERYEPEGDEFNNYFSYIPWSENESKLEDADVYMEGHGQFDEEEQGRYILGDSKCDLNDFEKRHSDFSNWIYKMDILGGAGNGDIMTFKDFLNHFNGE